MTPSARRCGLAVGACFAGIVGLRALGEAFLVPSDPGRDARTALALGLVLLPLGASLGWPTVGRVRALPRRCTGALLAGALLVLGWSFVGGSPEGILAAGAMLDASFLALGSVVLYPALRAALRPWSAGLPPAAVAPPIARGDRIETRGALAVAIPCASAALLSASLVLVHLAEQQRLAQAHSAALFASVLHTPEGLPDRGTTRILAAAGYTPSAASPGRLRAPQELPARPWAVLIFPAALGVVGLWIGARLGRRPRRALDALTRRMEALDLDRPLPAGAADLAPGASREVLALAQSLDALTDRLHAMSDDQRRALRARLETARLRSFVLAGVSHDLRGPLNAVLGFANLLLLGVEGPLSPGQRESLGAVVRGGEDLLQRIDDLLDAARLDADRMPLDRSPTPLGPLLDAALDTARRRLGDAVLHPLDLPASLQGLSLDVDPLRAAQSLGALLALCHSRPGASGPPTLSVETTPAAVTLTLQCPGVALTAAALTQMLDPFEAPPPGARLAAGLGLAVAVARRLVVLHGGAVEVDPEASAGMRLRITLPRAPEPHPA